jgi:hypothetical protein
MPHRSLAVEEQLAICESSDWFWWFGDYNPSAAVASFDGLYRRNLARLYGLLAPAWSRPAVLRPRPFARAESPSYRSPHTPHEGAGTMRRATGEAILTVP